MVKDIVQRDDPPGILSKLLMNDLWQLCCGRSLPMNGDAYIYSAQGSGKRLGLNGLFITAIFCERWHYIIDSFVSCTSAPPAHWVFTDTFVGTALGQLFGSVFFFCFFFFCFFFFFVFFFFFFFFFAIFFSPSI